MSDYGAFLASKTGLSGAHAFEPPLPLHAALKPFQADLVEWTLRTGRSALFADTGLGKTLMQLEYAAQIVRSTNRNALILTPLAVAAQTAREGEKFGIEARQTRDGTIHRGITVTNYDRLHLLNPGDFGVVVCDESAILKSFDGATRQAITQFMRRIPFRLLCSATPSPNDYTELGTSSEALGYLGHIDMLNRFFVNERNNSATGRAFGKAAAWRFKGHAEQPFWGWVVSWARAIRRPSDLGYADDDYLLPELLEREHVVTSPTIPDGMLFPIEAVTLQEQRAERRRTLTERCERVAELVDHDQPALVWCQLNDEGDLLERLIPGAVQVRGSDSAESKEEALLGFASGDIRVLVTKPSIAGWGLNFQHCAHMTFFPSHSFEQYYQGVRRCWRFGQTRPVTVDIVTTEGEQRVLRNLQQKAAAAEHMFAQLVDLMNHELRLQQIEGFNQKEQVPAWL